MSKGLEMLEILKQRNDTLKINHKIGSRDIANQEIKEITQCFDNYVIPVIEKDLEVLEILKKYIYYSEKSHRIRMREIRKSIYNFDYEDLKEWIENENKDTKNI